MGKMSRDKGNRVERRVVNDLLDASIPARRVPLSGASETHKGDIEFLPTHIPDAASFTESDWREYATQTLIAEVKARKEFPKWLVEYLGDNDCLVLVEDRREPLVVVPMSVFRELMQ